MQGDARDEGSIPGSGRSLKEGMATHSSILAWNKSENVSHPVMSDSLQPLWLFVTHRAPLSMEFSRQEYWSGLPFPSPGNLSDPGIKPRSLALQADSSPSELPGKLIPWTGEPGGVQSIGSQIVRHDRATDWPSAFVKEISECSLTPFHHVKTQCQGCNLWTRRQVPIRCKAVSTMTVDFPAPWLWGRNCCLNHSVYST